MRARILVADEEPTLVEALSYIFQGMGFSVSTAPNGEQALDLARAEKPDLILLSSTLPSLARPNLCCALRSRSVSQVTAPILMWCEECSDADKADFLDCGVDDLLCKPVGMRELLARVRGLLQRGGRPLLLSFGTPIEVGPIKLEPQARTLTVTREGGAQQHTLSRKECELLYFFMSEPNKVLKRETIFEQVWGDYAIRKRKNGTGTLDTHIKTLRDKLEDDPSQPVRLVNVRGIGFIFRA